MALRTVGCCGDACVYCTRRAPHYVAGRRVLARTARTTGYSLTAEFLNDGD
jgi:hypothetical protein